MGPPLASPSDVAAFGAVSEAELEAAAAALRGECRWHIAPEVTETVVVDSKGGALLLLPTLLLASVTQVRDLTGDTPAVLTGWRLSRDGFLVRPAGWPLGVSAVEVTMTHGHPACPADLLPVLARRATDSASAAASQLRLGSLSVSSTPSGSQVTAADRSAVDRYRIFR